MAPENRKPLIPLDAGWLFLLPGLVILSATILIPAFDDVHDAVFKRDRVLAIERSRLERVQNYIDYLDALDHSDESVELSLVASQLNLVPQEDEPLSPPAEPGRANASVFPELEPAPLVLHDAPAKVNRSLLERLATGERSRLWMIVAGAICIMIGLLCSTPSRRPEPAPADPPV